MSTSSPEDDLLIDLRALALIKPECKLALSDEFITLQAPGPLRFLQRFFYGDNRRKTIEKLKKVIDYSIEFCSAHSDYLSIACCPNSAQPVQPLPAAQSGAASSVNPPNHAMLLDTMSPDSLDKCRERYNRLEILNAAMKDALQGIANLEQTYAPSVASQINVRHKKLENQIEINQRHLVTFHFLTQVVNSAARAGPSQLSSQLESSVSAGVGVGIAEESAPFASPRHREKRTKADRNKH